MVKKNKGNFVQGYPTKEDGSIDFDKMPKDENGMTEPKKPAKGLKRF
jgi:hypothetical protein